MSGQDRERGDGKGGRVLPLLCRVLGTGLLLAVILAFLPLTAARVAGFEFYEVVSASMAPAIPVGSVVCVGGVSPEEIAAGDVIAFWRNGTVVTHRVGENRTEQREFVTKGDANAQADMKPVPYGDLIGRVAWHAPVLGTLVSALVTGAGKACAAALLVCGVLLHMLAGRLERRRE